MTASRVDQIKAIADTAEGARERVRAEAATRAGFAKARTIAADMTMRELVEAMIRQLRNTLEPDPNPKIAGRIGVARNPVRAQSIDQYETVLTVMDGGADGQYPTLGCLPLRQVTRYEVRQWLQQVDQVSPATAKRSKAVLSRAFDLAIDDGVDLWTGNPTLGVPLRNVAPTPPRELTARDLEVLRGRVEAWQTPRKRTDLLGIVDMLMGTGMRVGEVLALRWQDVDLGATPVRVTVTGTVVEPKGKGVVRQPFGKTPHAFRTFALPEWTERRLSLMDRRVQSTSGLVFPGDSGGLMSRRNVATRWRQARGEDYEWVTFRYFRKTVATRIERAEGPVAAAAQLGHSSPAVTMQHYVERATDAGDHTAALDGLAP